MGKGIRKADALMRKLMQVDKSELPAEKPKRKKRKKNK